MNYCPNCNQPHTIQRPGIGVIVTDICDKCYYERFAGKFSENQYFSQNKEFWRQLLPHFATAKEIRDYFHSIVKDWKNSQEFLEKAEKEWDEIFAKKGPPKC